MQIANSTKRGAALGAVFALLLSTLGFASPANAIDPATNGEHIAVTPQLGPVSNFVGLNTEDFGIMAYLPVSSHSNFVTDKVYWEVSANLTTVDVVVTESGAITGEAPNPDNDGYTYSAVLTASTSVVAFAGDVSSGKSQLWISAYSSSGILSSSPDVTVTVKFWIENTATLNGVHDTYEWYTTKTVTLKSMNSVTSNVTWTAPKAGDTTLTVSATVADLNFQNIVGGKFYLALTSSDQLTFTGGTSAGSSTLSSILTANQVASRSGVISQSFVVANSSGLTESVSISAHVRFSSTSTPVYASGYQLGATTSAVVSGAGVTALTNTVLVNDHATYSGQAATVRTNQTYTFVVGAKTESTSVSNKAISVALLSGPTLTANSKYINLNGGSATTSWPSVASPLTVTTGDNGLGSFTVTTNGFVDNDDFTVYAFVGNISKSLTVAVEPATYSVAAEYTTYASGAGETTNIVYSVTDQWGALSAKPGQQLKITRGGTGFNYSPTLSYVAVSGGKATVAFVPQSATATGSATVDAQLEELDYNNGSYVGMGAYASQVTVNVSAASNAFGTGLAASFSMSVSYHPSTVSWTTVTGKVTNTGSEVVVTGPAGLVFKNAAGTTFSDGITVRAGSGPTYTFYVSALLVGSHTITLTNGSDVTSSLLVVDAVSGSVDAATITFDTDNIVPGRTKIVTGTVTDANGNPVNTTGVTGSIAIAYSGTAGIPVGTFPTETDADGQFKISVLTAASDSGEFTLTASYLKDDSSTAAYDKVVTAKTITVGASSADSADQKITVGTFKGYVAIYTKGYMGQKLSAKVAGKWLVVDPIAAFKSNDYSRTVRLTGAGYTITVDLYIDGAFVRSEVVTTK